MTDDRFLTARELAKRLGVRPATVREWHRSGEIPAIRLTPKVIRYNLDAVVESLLERQRVDWSQF